MVIGDVQVEALDRAKQELGDDSVATLVCDVTQEEQCGALADTAIEKFGQINLVAPFAGIIMDGLMVSPDRETGKITGKMSMDQFQKVIDINLTGVFLTVRECSERMVKGMNQKALEKVVAQVPIGRLIEPEEVAMLVGDIYKNEALNGEVFFIHGGLRLGSKG